MQSIQELASARIRRGSVLTIGVFDGVHLGHRHLLERVKALAASRGLSSAVVTFRNHPRSVLAPDSPTTYLCPLEERLGLLREVGVEHVLPLTFTRELSQLTHREFIEHLVQHLGMRGLVVGPDFALGKGRAGTTAVLSDLGRELGYAVTTIEPVTLDGEVVSSTAVRGCVAAGEMEQAAKLLGRPFSLSGAVVRGDQRGRTLGFPTANLGVAPEIMLPADGIYCTLAHVGEKLLPSVSSIGVRPTFGVKARTVETYIMDFTKDIYDKPIKIELLKRMREERRFDSVQELIAQMKLDVQAARAILAAGGGA